MEGCPGGPYSGYLNFINSLGDNIQESRFFRRLRSFTSFRMTK
jgi:hypothetical protein